MMRDTRASKLRVSKSEYQYSDNVHIYIYLSHTIICSFILIFFYDKDIVLHLARHSCANFLLFFSTESYNHKSFSIQVFDKKFNFFPRYPCATMTDSTYRKKVGHDSAIYVICEIFDRYIIP